MKVLLTGVTGYIGSLLVDRLAADGHTIRGFARNPARAPAAIEVVAGDAVSGAGLEQALLAHAATAENLCGQSLDVGGPDTVSYGELIDRIRHHMLVDRPTLRFRRLTLTPIASRVAALIAGEEYELIGPLMDSLEHDLLPRDDRAAQLLRVRLHSLDAAIEHALRDWESREQLAAR
jgi:nucleoside-diphosphate-sugar epimerase